MGLEVMGLKFVEYCLGRSPWHEAIAASARLASELALFRMTTGDLGLLQGALYLLCAAGLFLSLWVVVSAPTMALLPLGVAVPELSPWLVLLNAIAAALALWLLAPGWTLWLLLAVSLLGLSLSLRPLLQLPATQAEFAAAMTENLGENYLKSVPESLRDRLRETPFSLGDFFYGIASPPVRIDRGIPFAAPEGVQLRLNLYRPPIADPTSSDRYPTVVTIYGGAWRQGSPDNDDTFSRYLAAQGYAVVAIDYRHAPEHPFPAQIEDVRTAIATIRDRADEWQIDGDRLALLGRSAGGHLAMLAAYDDTGHLPPFRAVVNYYAPVNLTTGYTDLPSPDPLDIQAVLRDFLGGTPDELPELYDRASPSHYLRPGLPPSLLVYAGRDRLVQAKFGRTLRDRLHADDNCAVFLELPWSEHAFDAVFSGIGNQLALYYTERFLAWALWGDRGA